LRTRALIGAAGLALAAAVPPAANADFVRESETRRFLPGEAVVIYKQGTDARERRDARGAAGVRFEESIELARTQVVTFDGSVRAAVARLEDQPGVAHAQPNYRYRALAAAPNDTHFGQLWGMGATPGVNVLPAWDRSRGAGQIIAVVDSGVDLTHPDLAGNLWNGPGGIHGRDFVEDDNLPDDFNLHGTHVAGTAAAVANNATGVAGVAPQARIMAIRALDGDGAGSSSDIAAGIAFAADNGARVINLSLGGPAGGGGDTLMRNAVTHAGTRGAVVVAAAGNENNNNDASPTTPCTLPNANLICVASVRKTGARSGFSNYGRTTVDVGAPGGDGSGIANQDILSAKPAWAAPLFSENFQTVPFSQWTATGTWGPAGGGIDGQSVTDSPAANYAPNTDSMFQKTAAIDLTAQRGCMIDYFLRMVGIEEALDSFGDLVDAVGVGVFAGTTGVGDEFAGSTPSGNFVRIEQSIERVDGRNDVKPTFTFRSDATVQGDGAYVDNFNLLCRGGSYDDVIGDDEALAGHSYTAISGTSMSAPHVAGVAALVRAVDAGVPPAQVVQALKNGVRPVPGMAGVTVTGGVVDAVGAINAALALPNVPPPPPPPAPQPPSKAQIVRAKISARGVLTLVVRGDAGNRGVATLTANIASAARVMSIARKRFRVGPAGRATVKLKLKRAAVRQLKRKGRLRVRSKIVLTNAAGLKSRRTSTIRLRFRRR
jgi:thermitase